MRQPLIRKYRIAKDYSHILWLIELFDEITPYRYWIEWIEPSGIVLRREASKYLNSAERLFEERLKDYQYVEYTPKHL